MKTLSMMPDAAIEIRPLLAADLPQIAEIQAASPEASQWDPSSYLAYQGWVATLASQVTGFLVLRQTAPGEREILNLAIAPVFRRRGIGKELFKHAVTVEQAEWFLEVRESNIPAIRFYEGLGFERKGLRGAYYYDPPEAAIVMRFLS